MTAALTAEGLHTYYGKSHILHGVSLEVEEGKITALLGRNGAGKSTTLRSLMGLTPAREGKITVFGQDTTRWPTFKIAVEGVGLPAVSPARGAQKQPRPAIVRRRAGDAVDRARAVAQPQAPDPR
jgi:ABC-type branched-subunit amino acid transport system ATPase component